ncbi:MAG: ATP-binding cassette domain-containing protein [Bdellovibrionales bacterium]|nr:ATP-binding cassette domain-containing protein [Bdellovibrionales bacterium]
MSVVQNLFRDYGNFQVDIPEWKISDQGITALWGPSGAGKTSIFRLMIGLEPCPGLRWIFGDLDLAQLSMSAKRLGVVFQSYDLFPHMTAEQNVQFSQEARKIPKAERAQDLEHLKNSLSLESCWRRKAQLLSGGEQQRVAIARALAGRPRFLFLDEPFSALDTDLRAEARELVKRVIGEFKVPSLLITHDKEDIQAMDAVVVRVEKGRLV